jgi:GNAT superfamily N-acetyltransferase
VLRRALPEDSAAIARVFKAAVQDAMPWLPELHTAEEDRRYFREHVLAGMEVWAVERDGEIAGFTALGTRDGVDFLEHIYVVPNQQRQGLGSELLDRAKERRPQGFRLWVFQRNAEARSFYERHGLRLVELTDGSANEEREPDALYEWVP